MKRNNHVKPSRFPAAVDLGNSSFRVLIADFLEDGSLNLLGIGEAPARGIREGKIDDIEEAAQALAAAIKEAEIMSGLRVERVLVGITGDHLHGRNVRESVIISDNTVTVSDIDNVRRLASVTVTEPHNQMIATLEQSYEIDGQKNIRQPLSMAGRRLSALLHIIMASKLALENIEKCILGAGVISDEHFVFSTLAAAQAVLTADEKSLGVCVVDIGAGTTEAIVFVDGVVQGVRVWNVASSDVHTDIARVHHASLDDSERAKKQIGVVVGNEDDFVTLADAGGGNQNQINSTVIRDTMVPRVKEILTDVKDFYDEFTVRGTKLSAGLVFVGDGSLLPGLVPLTQQHLNVNARIGYPLYRGEHHERVARPAFAVGLGLLNLNRMKPPQRGFDPSQLWRNFRSLFTD